MKKENVLLYTVALILLWGIGCDSKKTEAPPSHSQATTQISSTQLPKTDIDCSVVLDGVPPKMPVIKMNADPKCISMHKRPVYFQKVMVNKKGMLQNVFVYIKAGLGDQSFTPPSTPVILEQHGCMYEPHVLGIMINQPLEIINSDPVLHNIHALPKDNGEFNIAQPLQGMKIQKTFSHSEIMVPVKCEVHSWMRCYIGVLDNPFYAVSDSNGTCDIKGLSPGHYVLTAWHEQFGSQDINVTLVPGETKKVEFRFSAH